MKNLDLVRRAASSFLTLSVCVALGACHQAADREAPDVSEASSETSVTGEGSGALLYGRVTLEDGTVYEGRLRFGGDEEALWSNYFNGVKLINPWMEQAEAAGLPKDAVRFAGIKVGERSQDIDRPFMARLGDIARIDGHDKKLRVTLKSGSVFELGRYAADDLADGLRVWDAEQGVVDIGEWTIRSIELLPPPATEAARNGASSGSDAAAPLYGTVHTSSGDFTGLIQWNRKAALTSDALIGNADDGDVNVRFDAIRSIARRSAQSSLVTLVDGTEIVLSGAREVAEGNGGLYVDDARYGRVLVSWDAFESVDFAPATSAPSYRDYAPGQPLTGTIVTRDGRRLSGRLVYDLDESETTETLDAPARGIDYTIPFERVASIGLPGSRDGSAHRAVVTLRTGERMELELAGDLGDGNVGILVFANGAERATYVPWSDVAQVLLADGGAR